MRIKDYLGECDAYSLYTLICEMKENYDKGVRKFNVCIDELQWFRDRGIYNRLEDCRGNCIECELGFLDQEIEYK